VWGINEGRGAAAEVDLWLMNNTRLPAAGGIKARHYIPPPINVPNGVQTVIAVAA